MKAVLVCYLVLGVWVSRTYASCADVFSYGRDANGKLTGVVRVAPPVSYRDGDDFKFAIQLEVNDANSRGASLKLTLVEDVETATAKIKARKPLTYLVSFQGESLPRVKSVAVSDHTVCTENYASGVGTIYFLSHTIKIGSNPTYYRRRPVISYKTPAPSYRTQAPAASNLERAGLMERRKEITLSRQNIPNNFKFSDSTSGEGCEDIYSELVLGSEVVGLVKSPPPTGRAPEDTVTTKVSFIVGTLLQGQDRSGMKLHERLDVVANRLRSNKNDSIRYIINFPVQNPRPKIVSVEVNGIEVCRANPNVIPPYSTFSRSHTVIPVAERSSGYRPHTYYYRTNPPVITTSRPSPNVGFPVLPNLDYDAEFERERLMGRTEKMKLSGQYFTNTINFGDNTSGEGCEGIYSEQLLGSEVVGLVKSPPPTNRAPEDTVTTKVSFIVGTLLQDQNHTGNMKLHESLEEVADRLRATRSDPIRYIMHFPVQNPRPKIVSVEVNGREVCRANPHVTPPYSTFSRSHTVIPVAGGSSGYRPHTYYYRTNPPVITTSRPISNFRLPGLPNLNTCGTKESVNHLVRGGSQFPPGYWPWLAGIFVKSSEGPLFQCGASLVTMRHVITAAHCMFLTHPEIRELEERYLLVALGMHNVMNFEEDSQVQVMKVAQAIRHPRYNMNSGREFDICILILNDHAIYNPRVQPVCAWSSRDNKLVGNQGTVVGWGMNETTPTTNTPRSAIVPIVSREECRRTHPIFVNRITENAFCAGNRNGSGPCNGDSGGGLYVHEVASDNTMRWVLRGIVSFSVSKEDQFVCDLSHYVGYVDVNQFASWINEIIY